MASPCQKCGATKTGHAKPGLMRWLFEKLGFRLRVCGGCRRYRIFRDTRTESGSSDESSRGVDQPTASVQPASDDLRAQPASSQSVAALTVPDTTSESAGSALTPLACPECGSTNYRRS